MVYGHMRGLGPVLPVQQRDLTITQAGELLNGKYFSGRASKMASRRSNAFCYLQPDGKFTPFFMKWWNLAMKDAVKVKVAGLCDLWLACNSRGKGEGVCIQSIFCMLSKSRQT